MEHRPTSEADGPVHFGFRLVSPDEKGELVLHHFDSIARKYDWMNTILSFGLHLLWKRWTVEMLGLKPGDRVLDVCGGTGDLSLLAAREVGLSGLVALYDINRAMMQAGRPKVARSSCGHRITFVQGDGELISLKPNQFDAAMVGFGVRNMSHMERGFEEMHRVLRAGGKIMCLEFSRPVAAWFAWLYDVYSFHVMPVVGKLLAGSRQAYTYLPESIRLFPSPGELKALLEEIGFTRVTYRRFTNGIAVAHMGIKRNL
jgi:demethylmenaquinone methyltransferase/2-methoxy-6-polyprenyl-1,4-benzoquinol methylase